MPMNALLKQIRNRRHNYFVLECMLKVIIWKLNFGCSAEHMAFVLFQQIVSTDKSCVFCGSKPTYSCKRHSRVCFVHRMRSFSGIFHRRILVPHMKYCKQEYYWYSHITYGQNPAVKRVLKTYFKTSHCSCFTIFSRTIWQ